MRMPYEERKRRLIELIDEAMGYAGDDYRTFANDQMSMRAVLSCVNGLAELIGGRGNGGHASEELRDAIRDLRNRHGHEYFTIDAWMVWRVVRMLPRLREEVIARTSTRRQMPEAKEDGMAWCTNPLNESSYSEKTPLHPVALTAP